MLVACSNRFGKDRRGVFAFLQIISLVPSFLLVNATLKLIKIMRWNKWKER
jgi:hypothetical protein